MAPSIFSHVTHSVGALVFVDPQSRTGRPNSEGGKAWVQAVNNENGTLDVKYLVGRRNRVSLGVEPYRVHLDNLGTTARRTRERQNAMPSLLSPHHNEIRQTQQPAAQTVTTTARRHRQSNLEGAASVLRE